MPQFRVMHPDIVSRQNRWAKLGRERRQHAKSCPISSPDPPDSFIHSCFLAIG